MTTYQLGMMDRACECWRFHRKDFKIVSFDSLEAAEAAAQQLSTQHARCEVIVMTLHACFRTDEVYPPPQPIRETRRIAITTTPAADVSPSGDTDAT